MKRIKVLIIAQMVLFLCLLNPAVAAREVASGQPDISLKHNMLSVRLDGFPHGRGSGHQNWLNFFKND